jgi:hypothetical protein
MSLIDKITEQYATDIATRLALDDVIVKLVQNTAKSHSHKFTKYQKVKSVGCGEGRHGVVVDILRNELNIDTLDYSKIYHVLHLTELGEKLIVAYREDMLEAIDE